MRTQWKTKEIWLRREFDVSPDFKPNALNLQIHHDEEPGLSQRKTDRYFQTMDERVQATPLEKQAAEALKPGKNTLAVHCKQNTGGQYIDVGIVDVFEKDN